MRLVMTIFLAFFAVFAVALGAFNETRAPKAAQQSQQLNSGAMTTATFVGRENCMTCHADISENWAHTVHGIRFENRPQSDLEGRQCEACHGPGSAHMEDPADPATIIRFSSTSVNPIEEQNGMCLSCHEGGARIHWAGSVHDRQDIACSDCHNPMAQFSQRGLLANAGINQTCFACHKTQKAQFNRRSHMPLPEGQMSCVDCHNPHGGISDPMLKTVTVNETCYECHAEKRGPFVFEHAPVRENCLNCHSPHGSNHEKLLATPRPLLCQQCHSMLGHMNDLFTRGSLADGSFPTARAIGRSCQNCHAQIHGSNHPSGAKFHR